MTPDARNVKRWMCAKKRFQRNSVFWLAQMTSCVMVLRKLPPFVGTNCISIPPTITLSILQFTKRTNAVLLVTCKLESRSARARVVTLAVLAEMHAAAIVRLTLGYICTKNKQTQNEYYSRHFPYICIKGRSSRSLEANTGVPRTAS